MIGGETGCAKGFIRVIEQNDRGGVSVRIYVKQSDGRERPVFLNVYGEKARLFKSNGKSPAEYNVGDYIYAEWEVITKPNVNKETGKYDGYVTFKTNYQFEMLLPAAESGGKVSRPAAPAPAPAAEKTSRAPQQTEQNAAGTNSSDDDDW